jgi:uncharacterized protein
MALEEKINADMKAAMMARDQKKLEAIRAIKAQILLLKTSHEGYNDTTELKALQKMVKQRKETAEVYKTQGREDLCQEELFQAGIIEAYLPKALEPAELEKLVKEIMERVGAKDIKDLGKVMGIASKELAGKADGKAISELVKKLLSAA